MITIRSLLDTLDELAPDAPYPIERLCEVRGLARRGARAWREALARSYRGDFAQLLADLRKPDLVCLLATPTAVDGVEHYLPSAGTYRKEELVEIAEELFFGDGLPVEVVPLEEVVEPARARRGRRADDDDTPDHAVGAREACPCGSGIRFSRCHGDPRRERTRWSQSDTHAPPPPRAETPPRAEPAAQTGTGLHPNESLALALTSLSWPASGEVLRAAQRAIARVLHPDRLAADSAAARTAAEALGRVNDGFSRLRGRV